MSNSEILRDFLVETHENLGLLDADLLRLEQHPTDKSTLAQVFRTFHSVKGTAGFIGLTKLQAIAHSAEHLLTRLRSGELQFNQPIATALLRVVDAIREILASIETAGDEGAGDYSTLAAEVDRLRESAGESPHSAGKAEAGHASSTSAQAEAALHSALTAVAQPSPAARAPEAASSETATLEGVELSEPRQSAAAESSIRVDVGLLDKQMALVGELVLARNQILQYSAALEDGGFLGTVQRLSVLTTDLQASVMKARMQPIGNVLGKFPRIVRDLALACGKKVRFEMEGQETELDKTLIEAIRDPLTHLVRNAVDHGIEPPDIRRSSGKSEEGRLRMVASHEGGKVIIEIADDGRGIDVNRVRDKALAAGLISTEAAARMSHQELLRLVFLPGFSTAEAVTQFSGRGVGMDVVRTNIERIGGTVDLESIQGQGTTVRTKIPLTLAIIPALIVDCGTGRFAIPQVSLLELVLLEPDRAVGGIEYVHGAPVYRLRGSLLPLVFLDEQLQISPSRLASEPLNIVVLQAEEHSFGLVVDAVRDAEEIVVKPLQTPLKGIGVFAGAAIMGDGRIALVLDVLGLAQRAHVLGVGQGRATIELQQPVQAAASDAGESLLLFAGRADAQMAIPLSLVARLEEIPASRLESLGGRRVVQYRGEILPLVDVSGQFDGTRAVSPAEGADEQLLPVIVVAEGDQRVGLVVERILDIVEGPSRSPRQGPVSGVARTAVLQERVTELLDVSALLHGSFSQTLPAGDLA